jgi:mono/diheme cytochrome c family protein
MKTPAVALLALALLALALAPDLSRAADGAEIYRRKCASCHGGDGAGGSRKLGPLSSPELQAKSDEELLAAVARGSRDGKMPAFRGRIADDELRAVVAYLRTMAPRSP